MEEVTEKKPSAAMQKAQELAERIEAANKKHEELLDREETLQVDRVLGGRAEIEPTPSKKEETAQEYAKRVMSGNV